MKRALEPTITNAEMETEGRLLWTLRVFGGMRMKKATIQIAVLAAILLLVCLGCRLTMHGTYVASVPFRGEGLGPDDISFEAETPGVVEHGAFAFENGRLRVPVRPGKPGRTFVDLRDSSGNSIGALWFHVGRFGTIYDRATGGFTGDAVVLWAFTLFCFGVAAILFHTWRGARGPAFYAYGTIHAAGFGLFALLTGLTMLIVTLRHVLRPYDFNMYSAYGAICSASWQFMTLTALPVVVFAIAMAVSNVALVKHEGFHPKNVLGVGIGIALIVGEALAFSLYSRNVSGSEWEVRVWNTLCNVYASAFACFECALVGAIVCGLKAARHVPKQEADYILILGCRFRRDGTLTPLLRGRVDRAIAFWKAQAERTGREAVLMPSGGRGADEPIAEAEAMRRYLVAQGIPEGRIMVEDRSRNTYQNMEYSRALIERESPGAKVVYATTNYHVFRSGVWANLAGLPAEGIGSRTKWWYWPNAFMRECAGLVLNRIPQELVLLLAMAAFFGALSIALG